MDNLEMANRVYPVNEQNKVKGKGWIQFTHDLQELGWTEPSADPVLRNMFNLCSQANKELGENMHLLLLEGRDNKYTPQTMESAKELICSTVYNEFVRQNELFRKYQTTQQMKDSVEFLKNRHLEYENKKIGIAFNNGQDIKVKTDKIINGKTAVEYIKKVGENGWPDAQNDDVLRAFANVYHDRIPGLPEFAGKLEQGGDELYGENKKSFENLKKQIIKSVVEAFDKNRQLLNSNQAVDSYAFFQKRYDELGLAQAQFNDQEEMIQPENQENPDNEVNPENQENLDNQNIIENENNNNIQENENNDIIQENENVRLDPAAEEDPNLVKITDLTKQVNGMNWQQFHQAFADKGWKNAEKDNTLRVMFNFCNDDHPDMVGNVNLILNQQNNNELAENYTDHIYNYIRDNVLEPAKNGREIKFKEEQRASVLCAQDFYKNKPDGKIEYDFNAYVPVPEQPQVENNIQNNQNEIINEDNANQNIEDNNERNNNNEANNENVIQQENQNVIQQEEVQNEAPRQRVLLTNDEVRTRAEQASTKLKNATLKISGSLEYKHARDEFNRVQERWNHAVSSQVGQISEQEFFGLREDLSNALALADIYLDRKYKENDKSRAGVARTAAMEDTFSILEEQIAVLDARYEEIRKTEAPDLFHLHSDAKVAEKALDDATLHLRGSDLYKDAREKFRVATRKLDQLQKKYSGKESTITSDEIEETRQILMEADDAMVAYNNKKAGETLGDTTHNRTDAVSSGRVVLGGALRKLDELDAEKKKLGVEKMFDLSNSASRAKGHITEAEEGVHFGSSEYKEASKTFADYQEKMAQYEYNEQEHKEFSARDTDDLLEKMNLAEQKIDAYLATKRGNLDLGEKTQKRVDAMREAKENLIRTRNKVDDINKKRHAEALNKGQQELVNSETTIANEVRLAQNEVDGRSVYFGGEDYKKALDEYVRVCANEKKLHEPGREEEPSKHALKAEIAELNKAKEAILTYVHRKEQEKEKKEDKKLDAKGAKRLEVMNKAYNSVRTRLDIAEAKLQAIADKETSKQNEEIEKLLNEKRAQIPGKKGLDKIVAMKSAESINSIAIISRQKVLTERDQRVLKSCVAQLLLAENIKEGKFRGFNPPSIKNFNALLNQFANSKEFQNAYPKLKADPDTCRRLLTDKKSMASINKNVFENLKKSGDKNKIRENAIRANIRNQNNPEKGKNPLLG